MSLFPVISTISNVLKEDKEKCIQAGMTDYLNKPIDINKLELMLC